MAPGDYAGLQANRPRRLHSGTRSFSIAFFAEPEFLLLLVKFMGRAFSPHPRFVWKIPAAFSRCAEIDLSGLRALGTGGRKGSDLPLPVQLGAPANPAQGNMRMVLVVPFAIKRCRLKKPVLGGERNRIPNPPPFCAPAYEAGFRKQKKTQKSGLNNYHVTCRVKSSEG